ncbi:MAG: PEP-CTERM sorting domain-containing protein, partial [Verrucomicrobiales bacterium]|nr:PEP-CTERM sorting domain-containing protein [Verrucomicrobiales bacterium]
MKLKLNQSKLKLILLCALSASALNVFADNKVVTSSTTESNQSYNDSDPTLEALNVATSAVTYTGTNIILSTTNNGAADNVVGRGAYIDNGAVLSLTGGSITTIGSFGMAVHLVNTSSGTVNNVNIQTGGYQAYGTWVVNSTLALTGGSISTTGSNGYGIVLVTSSGTVNNVNVQTTGARGDGMKVATSSNLALAGGDISTTGSRGYGMWFETNSSGTVSNVNIQTTGDYSHGAYVTNTSALTLTDSDISTSGNSAYGIFATGSSTVTVNLNGNTLSSTGASDSHSILASSATVALTGSNGSVITGNVWSQGGYSRVEITLSGAGTELHGNLRQTNVTSVINLSIGAGVLLEGSGELDSLTLESGAIIGYAGDVLRVTGEITIGDGITIDFSSLTETGDYLVFDWSGATGGDSINVDQFSVTDPGIEGTFSVANNQLTFNATAVPEPSTWFLIGAGLGALALIR